MLKQSRKEQENINMEVTDESSSSFANNTSTPWPSKTPKERIIQETGSDCTSMSADSPGSILSAMTQQSVVNHSNRFNP